MVAYYKHDISGWMDGTEGLSDGEYRAYHVICQMIYLHEGPIVAHESGIAGRCNQHVLAFRRNLQKLIEGGKIALTPDGKITNKRAASEIEKIGVRRAKPPGNPPSTPPRSAGGPEGVGGGSEGGRASKPLKSHKARRAKPIYKTRLDKTLSKSDPAKAGSSGAERRRATRLPDDWKPTAADLGFAGGRGLSGASLRDEVDKFRNHWHAKAGRDAAKLDWPATWRTWCMNWQRFNGGGSNEQNRQGRQGNRGLSIHEIGERLANENRARDATAGVRPGDGPDDSGSDLECLEAQRR